MTCLRYRGVRIDTYLIEHTRTHTNLPKPVTLKFNVHIQTGDKSGRGKTVMEFKEALEQVLDCDESGQEVIALMCVICAYEEVCYMKPTLIEGLHTSGGSRGARAPSLPLLKKLHTRSRYSNRAVNHSNKAVSVFMRQCSLTMKL